MASSRRIWFLVLILAGCGKTASRPGMEEEKVRQAFAQLQAALKEDNAGKVWDLLDSDSRIDADRVAKLARKGYAQADAREKQKLEGFLGMSAKELAGITGRSFLKSAPFQEKFKEIPGSKIEKVSIQADQARVVYIEEDGDEERLNFTLQEGKWKVTLAIPKIAP